MHVLITEITTKSHAPRKTLATECTLSGDKNYMHFFFPYYMLCICLQYNVLFFSKLNSKLFFQRVAGDMHAIDKISIILIIIIFVKCLFLYKDIQFNYVKFKTTIFISIIIDIQRLCKNQDS